MRTLFSVYYTSEDIIIVCNIHNYMELYFSSFLWQLYLIPEVRYELKNKDPLLFGDVKCVYIIGEPVSY